MRFEEGTRLRWLGSTGHAWRNGTSYALKLEDGRLRVECEDGDFYSVCAEDEISTYRPSSQWEIVLPPTPSVSSQKGREDAETLRIVLVNLGRLEDALRQTEDVLSVLKYERDEASQDDLRLAKEEIAVQAARIRYLEGEVDRLCAWEIRSSAFINEKNRKIEDLEARNEALQAQTKKLEDSVKKSDVRSNELECEQLTASNRLLNAEIEMRAALIRAFGNKSLERD